MPKTYEFPNDFLWGAATSGHQIEGFNTNSDWWYWEQSKDLSKRKWPRESSGIACDSYHRFEEDFDLAETMNNNVTRISLEWARLQPEKGVWDPNEFEHYREVLRAAQQRGLKTFVTLTHFTAPKWLSRLVTTWENPKAAFYFELYAKKCAEEFGDLIDFYSTINEPQVYSLMGYLNGEWYPGVKNILRGGLVQLNMMLAHHLAYKQIKAVNKNFPVGIVKNIVWYETDKKLSSFIDKIACKIMNFLGRDFILRPLRKSLDFIGLNYYFTNRLVNLKVRNPSDYVSDLNWWINPDGLKNVLLYLSKEYKLPVYVTENGLADEKDIHRERFIRDHVVAMGQAIEEGANVKGYMHWSLLDNYEWHHGFWPRFGLVEIDREDNLKRIPRESFYYYAEICKNNSITETAYDS